MMRVASWWRELSGPVKFRLYTLLTLEGAIAAVVVVSAATAEVPWSAAGIVVCGAAAVVAVQAQPALSGSPAVGFRRWALSAGAAILLSIWGICAIIANVASAESVVEAARVTGIFAALLATLSIVSFLRRRWWIVVGISIVSGAALGASPAAGLRLAAVMFLIGGFLVATTLLTLWGLEVVDDLERAKGVEARLRVAEERLRFSRDLHDVVGRGFSAIAVKSELAATLSRGGAGDRAAAEMDDVKALAVESMDQMRELVRGYRDINLDGEVAGARSLLAAAGCVLVIEGDPAAVPAQFHEVAAWVVREGATNIVRHSSATSATLTIGAAGMSLRNNGTPIGHVGDPDDHSGLSGLAERLAYVGAGLDTTRNGETFVLEIQWEKK